MFKMLFSMSGVSPSSPSGDHKITNTHYTHTEDCRSYVLYAPENEGSSYITITASIHPLPHVDVAIYLTLVLSTCTILQL